MLFITVNSPILDNSIGWVRRQLSVRIILTETVDLDPEQYGSYM